MHDTPSWTGPRGRRDGLIIEPLRGPDNETVIYDTNADQIHALDAAANRVREACDGARSLTEIGHVTGLDDATVASVIARLEEIDLVQWADPAGHTRRTVLRGAVVAGAVVPFIASLALPALAAAQSPNVVTKIMVTGTLGNSTLSYAVTGGAGATGTIAKTATVYLSTMTGAAISSGSGDYISLGYDDQTAQGNGYAILFIDESGENVSYTGSGSGSTGPQSGTVPNGSGTSLPYDSGDSATVALTLA